MKYQNYSVLYSSVASKSSRSIERFDCLATGAGDARRQALECIPAPATVIHHVIRHESFDDASPLFKFRGYEQGHDIAYPHVTGPVERLEVSIRPDEGWSVVRTRLLSKYPRLETIGGLVADVFDGLEGTDPVSLGSWDYDRERFEVIDCGEYGWTVVDYDERTSYDADNWAQALRAATEDTRYAYAILYFEFYPGELPQEVG